MCRTGAPPILRSVRLEPPSPPTVRSTFGEHHVEGILSDKWRRGEMVGNPAVGPAGDVGRAGHGSAELQNYLQTELSDPSRTGPSRPKPCSPPANTALHKATLNRPAAISRPPTAFPSHDAAFNEDARVQLHNIKLQQALFGLNVRQAAIGAESAAAAKLRELRSRAELQYTQQDAKQIIDRNTDDENAAFMKVAERLIQQQDAAVASPAALRANIPQQGQVFTFGRSVAVDPWEDLRLNLKVSSRTGGTWGTRLTILGFGAPGAGPLRLEMTETRSNSVTTLSMQATSGSDPSHG